VVNVLTKFWPTFLTDGMMTTAMPEESRPVFDRRRAGFVFQETLDLLQHGVP